MTEVTDLPIGEGTRVTLHFSLALEDGQLIDSNFDKQPAIFEVGDGNLLPGFEKALFGLTRGSKTTVTIAAQDGFGEYSEENVQRLSRGAFAADMELAEGLIVSFDDRGQGELPGVISRIDGSTVWVDFNHPLAGRNILFEVAILDVVPATTH